MTGRLFDIAVASVGFGALLVLPGFGVQWLLGRHGPGGTGGTEPAADPAELGRPAEPEPAADRPELGRRAEPEAAASLVLAIAWSALFVFGAGALLLGLGLFSSAAIAVITLLAAAAGALPFVRWCLRLPRHALAAVVLGALALPWVWLATRDGFPPASSFQWYYWNLGTQLDQAGGIPTFVAEFGERVRWLPDYVVFNVLSEGYAGLTVGMGEAAALSYWRVPAALLGLVTVHLVLRLWLDRPAALGGAAITSATTFFILKFNAYKPEPLAIAFGLVAVWLVVRGVRDRRSSWVLLAGAMAGLSVGVHAIGATVIALLLLAAGTVEWLSVGQPWRWRTAAVLMCGAVAAFGVVLATGVSLQGRAVVASDAARPAVEGGGTDPTYTFFRRTAGSFEYGTPRSRMTRIRAAVDRPWPGIDVLEGRRGKALVALILLGLLLAAVLGRAGPRRGVASVAGFAALLAGGMLFFAVAFDTYVPQHTGIARFGSYIPFVAGLAAGPALQGYLLALGRLVGGGLPGGGLLSGRLPGGGLLQGARHPGRGRFVPAAVVAALTVPWAVATVMAPLDSRERVNGGRVGPEFRETDERLGPPASRAIAALRRDRRAGGVVLSNASTRGTIEFLTGREAPLEGRQPFIEDRRFLTQVNDLLLDTHEYFLDPAEPALLERLNVQWLLVADDPGKLGANFSYSSAGTPVEELLGRSLVVERLERQPYLERVRSEGGVALFRRTGAAAPIDQLGPADPRPERLLPAATVLALLLAGLIAAARRLTGEPPRAR